MCEKEHEFKAHDWKDAFECSSATVVMKESELIEARLKLPYIGPGDLPTFIQVWPNPPPAELPWPWQTTTGTGMKNLGSIGEKKMNLQPGKRYLLKKKYHTTESHLDEITVYERAADAIKYSCAPGGFPKWVLMKYLEDNFVIYAELPPNVPDEPKEEDYG